MRPKTDDPSGNQDSLVFEAFYEQWSEPVYRYLLRMIGAMAAEDLFQEVWMKVLEHRDQLRRADRFAPWIFRIARNLALNQMRTGRRKAQVWAVSQLSDRYENGGWELLEKQGAPDPPEPLACAIESQRREIVQRTLNELEPQIGEMLHLRYFEHLTLAEVAEVMDLPLGTVCVKVQRSLRVIRTRLAAIGCQNIRSI